MLITPLSKRFALLMLSALLLMPSAAWAFVKPLRVLAPELAGVHCYAGGVCTDAPDRLAEELALRSDAVNFVSVRLGAIDHAPRIIFCSSAAFLQSHRSRTCV